MGEGRTENVGQDQDEGEQTLGRRFITRFMGR